MKRLHDELRTTDNMLECFAGIDPPRIPPAGRDAEGVAFLPSNMAEKSVAILRRNAPASHHAALISLVALCIPALKKVIDGWKASPCDVKLQRVVQSVAQAWVDAFELIAWPRQWRLSLTAEARLAKPMPAVVANNNGKSTKHKPSKNTRAIIQELQRDPEATAESIYTKIGSSVCKSTRNIRTVKSRFENGYYEM